MTTAREGNVLKVPQITTVAQVGGEEILGSYARFTQKGGTLASGQGIVEAGQVLAYNPATKKWIKYAGTSDEVQSITYGGAGLTSYTLTFSGQTTASILASATAADVQAALEALSNIGAGNVAVTGNVGGPFTVTFQGTLADANQPQMTATPTGGTGTVTIATVTEGGTAPTYAAAGVLRKGVDATSSDVEINIVITGVLVEAKLINLDAAAKSVLVRRTDSVYGFVIL